MFWNPESSRLKWERHCTGTHLRIQSEGNSANSHATQDRSIAYKLLHLGERRTLCRMVMRHFHPCSSLDFGTAAKTMKQETVQIPRHSAMHTKTAANALGLTNNIACQTEYQWHNCYMQQHREAEITAPGNASKARDPKEHNTGPYLKSSPRDFTDIQSALGEGMSRGSLWKESSEMCHNPTTH